MAVFPPSTLWMQCAIFLQENWSEHDPHSRKNVDFHLNMDFSASCYTNEWLYLKRQPDTLLGIGKLGVCR